MKSQSLRPQEANETSSWSWVRPCMALVVQLSSSSLEEVRARTLGAIECIIYRTPFLSVLLVPPRLMSFHSFVTKKNMSSKDSEKLFGQLYNQYIYKAQQVLQDSADISRHSAHHARHFPASCISCASQLSALSDQVGNGQRPVFLCLPRQVAEQLLP